MGGDAEGRSVTTEAEKGGAATGPGAPEPPAAEEAGRASRGLSGAQPCGHLDLGLCASRISVA